jgi:hypothetical protein
MKTFFALFALLLALTLVQCTDNSVVPVQDEFITKGPGNGGGSGGGGNGGGGHTETATNNLSFPALCADGYAISQIPATLFGVEYLGPYTGMEDNLEWILANGPWYAQKVEGNVWQADFENVSSANVTFIDWGDAIESVDPKINRPYRLELALYSYQYDPMTAYTMTELAFPSSPQETQGTNTTTYESNYAAVASPLGRLAVQRYEGDATFLTWNGTQWVGDDVNVTAFPPEAVSFAQELNVGGRLIYGASTGGWKPIVVGDYRITFYMAEGSTVNLSPAIIADKTAPETPKVAENNQPYVVAQDNLTYVDVQATAGGGGGGGGH